MPLPKSFLIDLSAVQSGAFKWGQGWMELMWAGRRTASFFLELKLVHSSPGWVMINYFPCGVYDRLVIWLLELEYASKQASKQSSRLQASS